MLPYDFALAETACIVDEGCLIAEEMPPLDNLSLHEAVELAFTALENDRLALLCGAGLSMAPPSSIRSAAALAAAAKTKYDDTHGEEREPLSADIEEQSGFFLENGELATYYLRTLIPRDAFAGDPNAGHYATADLILTHGAELVVSTNVDNLIETAGIRMKGHVEAAIDRIEAANAPPGSSILFKLHGCWIKDYAHTLWTMEQLKYPPLQTTIPESTEWIRNHLMNRDVVVVGYFSHWEHLSGALEMALTAATPSRMLIVDPSDPDWLEQKAPAFYAVGEAAAQQFGHAQVTADDFLEALRARFSKSYVRRVLRGGQPTYSDVTGADPDPDFLEPPDAPNVELWKLRRDLEGCLPTNPSIEKRPADEPMLGFTLLRLLQAGAQWRNYHLELGGRKLRVLRASSQPLYKLEAAFDSESAPVAPEIVVAIGATRVPLKPSVVRGDPGSTIVRGSGIRWITGEEIDVEFAL